MLVAFRAFESPPQRLDLLALDLHQLAQRVEILALDQIHIVDEALGLALTAVSTSRRTPSATPAASFINRPRSSKILLPWVIASFLLVWRLVPLPPM